MSARATAAFAALVLGLALGCDDAESLPSAGALAGSGPPVVLGSPVEREFSDRIEALGTVRANESVVITARVTETVQRVLFEEGAEVEADAVLVELTSTEEAAQLDEVRAQYTDALQRYERVVELRREGTESQSRLDAAQAELDAASARRASLQARLSDRLVRAPFGGVLGLRDVSPGSLVQPGDRITTLDDIDVVKLDFSVPETFLSGLRAGLAIAGSSAAFPGRSFEGRVVAVDTRLDPRTRAVTVRAEIDNADHALRPGMLLGVVLEANRRRSLSVPESALVPVADRNYAIVVDRELKAERVEVEIGRRVPGHVEVLSGLAAEARVVVDGASKVRPGGSVREVGAPNAAPGA